MISKLLNVNSLGGGECHHTCRKGHKGVPFDKFTLRIQEVVRVKSVRALPFALIVQN